MKKKSILRFISVIMSISIIFSLIAFDSFAAETEDMPSVSWKDKIDPVLWEKMNGTTDKIPVWLWFKDIDYSVFTTEVYNRTGYTEDTISVISEYIDEKLADAITNLDSADYDTRQEIIAEFSSYLKRTEAERKIENDRTETYITELHNVQAEMYPTYNSDIIAELGISERDIISAETQVPFYIVNLNAREIENAAKNEKVSGIYLYENGIESYDDISSATDSDDIEEVINASEMYRVKNELEIDGSGVSIGFIESGHPKNHSELPQSTTGDLHVHYAGPTRPATDHATIVARIAAGTKGVASGSTIYSCPISGDTQFKDQMIYLADQNVNVANMSHRLRYSNGTHDAVEVFVNYMAYYKKLLLVKTAGNTDDSGNTSIGVPGLAYNCITVGGFFNSGSIHSTDTDIMYEDSNFNSNVDNEIKPDIVAPQSTVDGTGTSFAAPFATGTIALLYKIRPSLKVQPETVKAILMASCHKKVKKAHTGDPNETMEQGLTTHQGAGALNPYLAIAIAASGNYGVRTMGSTSTSESVEFLAPSYGSSSINCSIAWLKATTSTTTDGSEVNLNLKLYLNNSLKRTSALAHSSAEMTYIELPSSNSKKYKAMVERISATGSKVRFAYAFSVNNNTAHYQQENELPNTTNLPEGLYYIKNRATGKVLSYSSGNVLQQDQSFVTSQLWLVKGNTITSASTNHGRLYSSYSNGVYLATVNNTNYTPVTINEITELIGDTYVPTGEYRIMDSNSTRRLCIPNSSSIPGTQARWISPSNTDISQKWLFEQAAYEKGDVNMDGSITSDDYNKVLQYSVGLISLTDVEKYLGDLDLDGDVDSNDALLISQILSS